MFEGAAT